MTRFRGTLLILLTALGLLAPTRGASPRITLRLEHATCEESARALTEAADIPIQVIAGEQPEAPDAPGGSLQRVDLSRRHRWDWKDVTLSRAMRELAGEYGLQVQARPEVGYYLFPGRAGDRQPTYAPLGLTEARGYAIQVRSLLLSGSQPSGPPGERLQLRLHGQTLNGDPSTVVGVEDLIARDDRGGILTSNTPFSFPMDAGFPDEWSTYARLTGLQPGATRLTLLEGTLIAAPMAHTWRCEFPLPGTEKGARKPLGERTVEFVSLEEPRPVLFVHPSEARASGPVLQFRIVQPDTQQPQSRSRRTESVPLLVGASGKIYAPQGTEQRGTAVDGQVAYEVTARYPAIEEPLRAMRIGYLQRREERAQGTFRLRNLPLPSASAPPRPAGSFGTLQASPLAPGSADHAPEGGTLSSPVRIAGKPAPPGRLWWGLSAPDGSSRTRWYDSESDARGASRLTPVRPGRYRILRIYRPATLTASPALGWWRNDECTLQVEAGKETSLPPLQLEDIPPPALPSRLPARAEDLEARAEQADVSYTRVVEFLAPPRSHRDGTLSLRLSGTAGGVATNQVVGLRNLVARDDRGGLLLQRYPGSFLTTDGGKFEGLKWSQSLALSAPHPQARRLEWIEGDLMAYGRVEKVELDVPLPLPPEGFHQELGPVILDIEPLESFRPELHPGEPRPPTQYRLRGKLVGAPGTVAQTAGGGTWQPVLIGRSETVYQPVRTFDTQGNGTREFRCRYEASELPVKARFQFTVRTDLESVGSFRLTGVQLPDPKPYVPPKTELRAIRNRLRPVAGEARLAAFLQEDGGADLRLPLRIEGQPELEGSLMVGLAARTPTGWGPLRWVEAAPFEGEVRLRDLQPGTYRVLRVFRPDDPARKLAGGRWTGGELQVTLLPGKETILIPLVWQSSGR